MNGTGEMRKPSNHRRIAWRLSARITGSHIGAFIAIDVFLAFLILLAKVDEEMLKTLTVPFIGEKLVEAFEWLKSWRYLDICSFWALASVGALQLLLLIGQGVEMRRHIRVLLEPLRELRVAADAFSGAAADAAGAAAAGAQGAGGAGISVEALRRMTEALSQVEARDMNAHIAADSVSPELRPLLETITDMLNRLEASYAAQTKFVADASHELRTPIAVIQGYANLLSRWGSEDPDTLHESIEAIRSEADAMKQMVNQLLFLARGDSDTLRIDMQRVDLVPVANEVLREERMLEEERASQEEGEGKKEVHEISAKLPKESVVVSADQALIKQLIRILADNSVKYTPPDGHIVISVSKDQESGRAFVMVQDEGQGIPPDILPRIFDRFVRADEARTRNSGGAGLGLSIAKQIAERHGGTLEVYSAEGVGTRFTLTLPLLPE